MSYLSKILAHPLTKGLSLDDPRTTELRSQIIQNKTFLRQIYQSWYRLMVSHIPAGKGAVLEIGSGGGFLKELHEDAYVSEVFATVHIDVVLDAMLIPFKAATLKSILMVNVLHHIQDPALFFAEAARFARSGGRCLFIEPWNTPWARWVYQYLHHEPFNTDGDWTIPPSGPLSGANAALPWIFFERDRSLFCGMFPEWKITSIIPMMPFVYLLSGGVSLRSLMPGWFYQMVRTMERVIPSVDRNYGMFAFIAFERN